MFVRCAKGRVYDLELELSVRMDGRCLNRSYLTRSKIVTLLPTGDSRHVPSGVNSKLPLL